MIDEPYGKVREPEELTRVAEIVGQCFGATTEEILRRIDSFGSETVRVYREETEIAGCFWFVPMGQWFGGNSVPMTGVAAVGVPPEDRGRGVAARMMQAAVQELAENGIPLAGLYPASVSLYRLAGFEPAGCRFHVEIPPQSIGIRDRELRVRAATEKDEEAIAAVYRRYAAGNTGNLDRGEYIWNRVRSFRDEPARGFVVERDGEIAGYVYYVQQKADPFGYDLLLTDFTALTPEAGRRLWTFLASHGSMAPRVRWFGGPSDPLLALLPEIPYKMSLMLYWATRVVDAGKALAARGYPAGLEASLEIAVEDPLLPGNREPILLEVSGGRGTVRPGGKGSLQVNPNGLAALYTGFHTPAGLVRAGMLRGSEKDLRSAEAVFGGATPWMRDMF